MIAVIDKAPAGEIPPEVKQALKIICDHVREKGCSMVSFAASEGARVFAITDEPLAVLVDFAIMEMINAANEASVDTRHARN